MAHVPLHDESTAPQTARDTLQGLKAKMGTIPAAYAVFAASPDLLNTLMPFHGAVMKGTPGVDGVTRQAIALAVSVENDCRYCKAAHTAGMKHAGASEGQIRAVRSGSATEPRLAAILDVARLMTRDANAVTPAMLDGLRDHGLDDRDLVDVVAVAAHFNFFNRVLDALGVSPPS